MGQTKLSLRIDLANGSRLGPGKVSLLEAVRRCASISAAAREQGMSYRRAWLLINDMNQAFAHNVVETFPGRSQGKGARLTDLGEQLVTLYRSAEERTAAAVAKEITAVEKVSNASYIDPRVKQTKPTPGSDSD